jgi:enamine deaminase RidA (YjgF/YER057c/UK114 family)
LAKKEFKNMLTRMTTRCLDETCFSCAVAGDFIFLARHTGGYDKDDIVYQMRAAFESMKKTLASAGATMDDIAQINLYLVVYKLQRD